MRALLFAGLAAAAVVGLVGCGQESAPANGKPAGPTTVSTQRPPVSKPISRPPEPKPPAGATPSAPVSVGPSGVVVPDGVTQVPADQVDASALPAYYDHHGEVWVFDDGYSLQMFAAASSGCSDAEAVVVDQSASGVRITLRPLPEPPGGRPDDSACTAVMTPRPVTVALREPLGDRKIYLGIGR